MTEVVLLVLFPKTDEPGPDCCTQTVVLPAPVAEPCMVYVNPQTTLLGPALGVGLMQQPGVELGTTVKECVVSDEQNGEVVEVTVRVTVFVPAVVQ